MSIYSGFPTRKDESNYNRLLSKLFQLLQEHLLEFLGKNTISNEKITSYSRLFAKMQQYEEHKYLPPKFSQLFTPLASICGIPLSKNDEKDEQKQTQKIVYKGKKEYESQTDERYSQINELGKYSSSTLAKKGKIKAQDLKTDNAISTKSRQFTEKFDSARKIVHRNHDSFYEHHEKKLKNLGELYCSKPDQQQEQEPQQSKFSSKAKINNESLGKIIDKGYNKPFKNRPVSNFQEKQHDGKNNGKIFLREEMRKRLKTSEEGFS